MQTHLKRSCKEKLKLALFLLLSTIYLLLLEKIIAI